MVSFPSSSPSRIVGGSHARSRSRQEIRAVLGWKGQFSPPIDTAALRRCYYYLCRELFLPCQAWYSECSDEEGGGPCTVVRLIDPASGLGDGFDGIFSAIRKRGQERNLPLIELEFATNDPNSQLVESYWDCLWHRR